MAVQTDFVRLTFWDRLRARLTTPLVRGHIESLWKELDSARFRLSWYTNGNAEMQREHYRHQVDEQKREIAKHKEHISRLRDLLWSAEQELKELKLAREDEPVGEWPYDKESACQLIASAAWPWEATDHRESWAHRIGDEPNLGQMQLARARKHLEQAANYLGLTGGERFQQQNHR